MMGRVSFLNELELIQRRRNENRQKAKKDWSLFNPPPERGNPRRPSHEPSTLEIIFENLPPPRRRMSRTVQSEGHAFMEDPFGFSVFMK